MPPIKTYAEPRFAVLYCGVLGLVIPLWVITTYAAQDDRRAILISLLIIGGFAFGIYWLWYYASEFAAQERELERLDSLAQKQAYFEREVVPHVSDAWTDPNAAFQTSYPVGNTRPRSDSYPVGKDFSLPKHTHCEVSGFP